VAQPGPSVAFVTYNGLLDPLGPSQILPYVERLARDRTMHVLSFERRDRLRDRAARDGLAVRLREQGIGWRRLTYHKRPGLLAKAWDLARGVIALRGIVSGENVGLVHARGYMPMEIAMRAIGHRPILFDIRGLQGEEYVDGGIWSPRDLRYLLLKRSERSFFARADAAIVLTHAIAPYVRERFAVLGREVPVRVIPSCVDTARFRRDEEGRRRVRGILGAGPGSVLFVYAGSLGTWYMADEMASFVRAFRDRTGRAVRLLWLVNNEPRLAAAASSAAGLDPSEVHVRSVAPDEVPAHLSAADVGLALVRPTFSKKSSSPTKYAEYLAVGLPVVLSSGVGDSDEIARRGGGVALTFPSRDGALSARVDEVAALVERPREQYRNIAIDLFDVDRVAIPEYRALYEELLRIHETGMVGRRRDTDG